MKTAKYKPHLENVSAIEGQIYEVLDIQNDMFQINTGHARLWIPETEFEPIHDSDEPKKFGELSELDQMNLFQSWLRGEVIQALDCHKHWYTNTYPNWGRGVIYRVKPIELTKPSINWDHVHEDYKWLATDADSLTYLFENKPSLGGNVWLTNDTSPLARSHDSLKNGTCNWEDSLVERPHE